MPRQKKYNEVEVAEKAMQIFWSKGYGTTSTRMLEKGMGINLFSIYASFKNKEGVLLASMKCYKNLLRKTLLTPLSQRPKTIDNIKQFFYDFLQFTKENNQYKGCLLINTANELGSTMSPLVLQEVIDFSSEIALTFKEILSVDTAKNEELIQKQTNYFFVALQGIILTAKGNTQQQIEDYIEITFLRI